VDVLRRVGQEDLAGAGHLHQRLALAGHRLLEHPAQAAEPACSKGHVALVGDHRAELGLDGDLVEADLEELRVLEGEAVGRLGLVVLRERRLHGPTLPRNRDPVKPVCARIRER
jgi:hypothetical protein